jgi:hypothetical protein
VTVAELFLNLNQMDLVAEDEERRSETPGHAGAGLAVQSGAV